MMLSPARLFSACRRATMIGGADPATLKLRNCAWHVLNGQKGSSARCFRLMSCGCPSQKTNLNLHGVDSIYTIRSLPKWCRGTQREANSGTIGSSSVKSVRVMTSSSQVRPFSTTSLCFLSARASSSEPICEPSSDSTLSSTIFALIAACGTVAATIVSPPAAESSPDHNSSASVSSTKEKTASSHRFLSPDFISDAVSKAAPALVNLTVETSGGWGMVGQSTGSGFIITEDGYVVTNNHVVAGSMGASGNKVTVTMSNGRKYRGRVHSTDKMSDLALVKIEPRRRGERFPVMRLGTSCNLKPGQWVVALGSPLTLQNTVTAGIISSVARHSSEIGMSNNRNEYIQTDAAINVGNSGGPLINIDGEVIGINTMKTAQGAGIGFAIPMDSAWQVIKQLRAHKKVVRPYIGMRMVTLDPKIVADERLQNPNFPPVESGVMVTAVAPGSPSETAGIEPGDIVLSFDGKPVRDTRDILNRLGVEVGKRIELRVVRDGDEKRLVVVTGRAAKQ